MSSKGSVMITRKIVIAALGAALAAAAGLSFHRSRNLAEPVVLGPGVTAVKKLSDYFPPLAGTVNDVNVYMLEGEEPGGAVLVLGGTHPEEPAGRLAGWILAENARVLKGRLFVILTANGSASRVTRLGGAYPPDYAIETPWGARTFRMGDRWSGPLDQWPDPEVYVHYPSRQELAYIDIRNLNRTFPGRPGGTLTERTGHAILELVRKEGVDVAIDLHEAELQYPVISTIVAHEKGADLATLASMMISSEEGFAIGVENSPQALRGLSHREIGDHTGAISLLLEAPQPFLDATRGRTDRALLLTGQDEFVVRAGKRGLLFERIDESGWPIDVRVGRHTSTILRILEIWSEDNPERAVVASGVPRYEDVVRDGTGAYLKDAKAADPARIVYE
jgi:predicted deacylase